MLIFWGIFFNNRLIRFLVGSNLQKLLYSSDSIRGTAIVLICYGMNNILLSKTEKQYTTKIFTIKIQNLNIKSGVFFSYKNLFFFVRLNISGY